jgi:tRNA A37 threonylcarbamoyladenosine biosynthesis protein TsaE
MQQGTLHFISGRLPAGKTTLARELAADYRGPSFGGCVALETL